MRISWLGHACFMVEHEGYRVVLDPFCDVPGCRDTSVEAEKVLCSHGHYDHHYTDGVTLHGGKESPFTVETVATCHDEKGGTLRGENTVHCLRAGGLSVVHLGDLGHLLSEEQAAALRGCDALLIPVGGTYTLDAAGAAAVVQKLQPRVVIPMHYRGESFGFDNIDTVEPFLAHFPAQNVRRLANDTLELTAQTPQGVTVLTFGV